ncbi:hypothetical protein [Pseudoclavibacter sp. VKM Ac-2888]|uniref:hypothetical protein n=1 Tax=Pseudoclavibacter sp. VKM Ac-2888 TaxID=2783830 RepID=UPI00188B42CC|nr:hypothetical protein [Pseudoclavibacter sp. VKM Ac-2888]MBF4550367.1 hypothetical protein [Pseudoclavibacter sp. VKM Ac-2888]
MKKFHALVCALLAGLLVGGVAAAPAAAEPAIVAQVASEEPELLSLEIVSSLKVKGGEEIRFNWTVRSKADIDYSYVSLQAVTPKRGEQDYQDVGFDVTEPTTRDGDIVSGTDSLVVGGSSWGARTWYVSVFRFIDVEGNILFAYHGDNDTVANVPRIHVDGRNGDKDGPELLSVSMEPPGDLVLGDQFTIDYTARDPAGVASVGFTVSTPDGSERAAGSAPDRVDGDIVSGTVTFTVDRPYWRISEYTVVSSRLLDSFENARVVNAADNAVLTALPSFNVTYIGEPDNSPPEFVTARFLSPQIIWGQQEVLVEWRARDDSEIQDMVVILEGPDGEEYVMYNRGLIPRTKDADGLFTSIAFTHFEPPAGPDGTYAVTGIAFRDIYYNISVVNAEDNCILASLPTFTFLGYWVTEPPAPTAAPKPSETEVPAVCQTAAPTESPVPTETALPTETAVPTETALPTETAVPTETALPTETAVPTETTTATATPTSTEAPTASAPPETAPPTQSTEPVPGETEPEPTWWATPTVHPVPSESATQPATPGSPSASSTAGVPAATAAPTDGGTGLATTGTDGGGPWPIFLAGSSLLLGAALFLGRRMPTKSQK